MNRLPDEFYRRAPMKTDLLYYGDNLVILRTSHAQIEAQRHEGSHLKPRGSVARRDRDRIDGSPPAAPARDAAAG